MIRYVKRCYRLISLNFFFRKVKVKGLNDGVYLGKSPVFTVLKGSEICFTGNLYVNNFVVVYADLLAAVKFGKNVSIGDFSTLRATIGSIEIGDNTLIAQHVKIVSSNHNYQNKNKLIVEQGMDLTKVGVKIGSDVWIGAGCTILPGVEIGDGAVVGANSVVSKNIPPYAVAVGTPAAVVKYRD